MRASEREEEPVGMRVYLAAPYSNGDPALNVERVIEAAHLLIEAGHEPFVPHLSHFIHARYPHTWETWMTIDLAWLPYAEAFVRLDGESKGADIEERHARAHGIPIYSLDELLGCSSRMA